MALNPRPNQDSSKLPDSFRVTTGAGTLPNDNGQVWREYDIRPFTAGSEPDLKTEKVIIDWILRETGTDAWFSDPLGLLHANRTRLKVYHTPEMQTVVWNVVQRFVAHGQFDHEFGMRLIAVGNPNWRAKVHQMLRPIEVKSPAIEAWLLAKEDAAVLASELIRRTDAVELSSPDLAIRNGETHSIRQMRPVSFNRLAGWRAATFPAHPMALSQIDEGFTLQFTPLLSVDRRTADAVVKLEIDQVEDLNPVWINLPTGVDPRQRAQVQVPQTSSCRLHERFRWPVDEVLLISSGLVPAPVQARRFIPVPKLVSSPARSDAVILLDYRGPVTDSGQTKRQSERVGGLNNRGRY